MTARTGAGSAAGLSARLDDFGFALRSAGRLALEWCGSRGLVFNPLAHHQDPYPRYRRLRERDPVHRSHLIGGWALFRYEDAVAVLRDGRFSSDDRKFFRHPAVRDRLVRRGVGNVQEFERRSMLRLDPPDHTRLRALVQKSFTPRAVEALQPRVDAIAERLFDQIEGRSSIELVADLALPLPVVVIAELLGVPSEDRDRFKVWSAALVGSLGAAGVEEIRRALIAGEQLRAYFEKIALERQGEPRDDLLSALVHAEEQGDRLTREEVFVMLTLLLVAGNETTTKLIGSGLVALLRHPEQLEQLRRDPAGLDAAIEEMLRYDSPVQATSRIALEDAQIGRRTVRRGEQLLVAIGSANRDPERFADPDRFDIARGDRGHLAFGVGRHFCLGAALARLEARAALGGLLRRYRRIELASESIRWSRSPVLRGPRALPLRVAH